MKALVYHGPGPEGVGGGARPEARRPDRRDRAGRHHHDLRHRPAHPQGRRPGGDRRPDPRARGRRDDHRGRPGGQQARGRRPGDHLLHQLVRLHARTATSSCPRTAWPTRAPPASAGSSATSSTAPRPSSSGCPFADNSLHKLPEGVSDEAAVMLSDILPTGFEIGVRNGRVKPGDVVAVVGAGPVGPGRDDDRRALRRLPHHRHRPRRQPARAGQAASAPPTASTAAARDWKDAGAWRMTDGLGVDVAIEAVGHARRPSTMCHRARPPRRHRGERRRARQAGRADAPGPVDQGHRDHHGPGQRHHHADAAQAGRPAASSRRRSSPPTTSPSTRSSRPTTPSAARPRPRRSRSSSPADRAAPPVSYRGSQPDLRFEWFSIVQRLAATPAAKINIPAVISSWPA